MLSEGERNIYLALYLNKTGMHVREISRYAKLTLPSVVKHLNAGQSEGRILFEKKGRLKICRLNFATSKIIPAIQDVELTRFQKLPDAVQNSLRAFTGDLAEKPLLTLVFGSFAKNAYTRGSDLDILLVFQRLDDGLLRGVENSARKIAGRTGVRIQPVSLDYSEFKREMLDIENDFMKDIRKDALILGGLEVYVSLLGRVVG
jgi:predicted nucleotidyltransferase